MIADLTTDEARQALADELERRFSDEAQSLAQLAVFTKACLPDILASLRAKTSGGAVELQKLSDAASPGPWAIEADVITETPSRLGSGLATGCGQPDRWPANRAFIVALVNDFRARQKEQQP